VAVVLAAQAVSRPRALSPRPEPTIAERPQPARVAQIKLPKPGTYDGKPKMPFRSWWDSVVEYFSFYPETLDRQRIAFVGALLTEEAKEWHKHHVRIRGRNETWNTYPQAIQKEYEDPEESTTIYAKMKALKYNLNIKAFLTSLSALNIHAGATGEGLQDIINRALLMEIINMRFSMSRGPLMADVDVLQATYEAGGHVERFKNLKV
jgi:hypothetical protein